MSQSTRPWRRKARSMVVRVGAFIAGAAILYHEIWLADSAEPLAVGLGLWLCGVPPAMFFDGIRKLTDSASSSVFGAPERQASQNGDMPRPDEGER